MSKIADGYLEAHSAAQVAAWGVLIEETGGSPYIGLTHADWASYFPTPTLGIATLPPEIGRDGPAAAPTATDQTIEAVGNAAGSAALGTGVGEAGPPVGAWISKQVVPTKLPGAATSASVGKSAAPMVGAAAKAGGRLGRTMAVLAAVGRTNPIGIAVGTIVNLVWEPISNLLSDDYDESDTRAYQAGKGIKAADRAIASTYKRAQCAAKLQADMKWETVRRLVAASDDADELRAIARWAAAMGQEVRVAEKSIPSSEEIGQLLLARWRAQRMGTADCANRETDPGTYGAVRKTLMENGPPTEADSSDVDSQTGIFLEQMRYAWGRLGVRLDNPIAQAQAVYNAFRRRGPTEMARGIGGTIFDLSGVASPAAFAASMLKAVPHTESGRLGRNGPTKPEDLAGAANKGVFRLTCHVELKESKGYVVVSDFHYRLVPDPAHDAVLCADICRDVRPGEVDGPYILKRDWHDSPLR